MNTNKEIINIKHIILIKGKKELEIQEYNDTNKFGKDCHHNLHIGTYPALNCTFGDNCHDNIFLESLEVNLDNFWDRFKFCFKLLFKYS